MPTASSADSPSPELHTRPCFRSFFASLFAVTLCLAVWTPAGFAQSSCTGLCLQQTTCPSGTTSITGTVYAPNGSVPLPNVLVYVPNGGSAPDYGVQPLATGVANPPTVSGSPLVSTFSSPNGTFTLQNMPVGTNIPLVIQAGKWRRMISIPTVSACTNTAVAAASTSLPQSPEQFTSLDSIPKIGVVTGQFDNLECTVRQIGVNNSQFTDPAGTGAVNFYLGDNGAGAQIDSNTPTESSLWSTQANVNSYDLLLLPSQSAPNDPAASAANQAKLVSYANAGGRVFTSGDSWDWLYNVSPFSGTAVWDVNQGTSNHTDTGFVDEVSNPYGQIFASWLVSESISGTSGQIPGITGVTKDYGGVIAPTSQWLYVNDSTLGNSLSQIFSFDTPIGAAPGNFLGRVFFKDATYGEVPGGLTTGVTFPAECSNGAAPPSQLVLDFLLFNLSGNLPLPQTLSFTTPAPASAANNTNFTVAATATSNLTVFFTGSGGCSYVDNQNGTATYTMNSATTACSVVASQPGSGPVGAGGPVDYAAAPQVTETTLLPQAITFTMNPPPNAYLSPGPGNQFTVAATGGGSGNPVTFTSSGSCTNVGGNYTMSQIPTTACLVIANQAGDGVNYAAAPTVTQTVQIGQIWYDLSSPPNQPLTAPYGSSFYTVTGTTTSELPPTYSSSGVCSPGPTTEQIVGIPEWSATYTMNSGTGTCTIQVSIAGNATWAAAPTINLTPVTTATKATNTVTLNNVPSSAEYGSSFTISASGLGTGAISYSSDGVVCTNSGATYTMISGTGSCTATATQAADSNYALGSKSGSVAALPANSNVAVQTSGSPSTYGSPVTFTATITSDTGDVRRPNQRKGNAKPNLVGGTVAWSSNTGCGSTNVSSGYPGTATCATSSLSAGSDLVTATYSGDANHTAGSPGSTNQTVNQAASAISVTSVSPSQVAYGSTAAVTVRAQLTWSGSGSPPTAGNVSISGSGLNGTFGTTNCLAPSGDSITCTNVYTPTGTEAAGTYTMAAAFSADTNYKHSSSAQSGNFIITPANCSGIFAPANNATLGGTSATFSWCATGGATAYWIDVGSTPGGNTYYQSGSLPSTTFAQTVNSLPNDGSTVYVTWYAYVSGAWQATAYTYTAFGVSSEKGAIASPAPNSILTGSSAIFTWTAGTVATAYWIDIGSSPGGSQYFQSGNLGNVLTQTVSGLPTNGSTINVTLYSLVSGQWLSNAYTYTAYNQAGARGVLQTPTPGSTLAGSSATFIWTAGTGASAYWLDVGSSAGGNQYSQSGNLGNVLTTTVNTLPTDGSMVYVTLYSLVGGFVDGECLHLHGIEFCDQLCFHHNFSGCGYNTDRVFRYLQLDAQHKSGLRWSGYQLLAGCRDICK